jgi:hypothetical protein
VIGDPLEQAGVITWRPLADDQTGVELVIQRARSGSIPLAARDLHGIFVERARAYSTTADGTSDRGDRESRGHFHPARHLG